MGFTGLLRVPVGVENVLLKAYMQGLQRICKGLDGFLGFRFYRVLQTKLLLTKGFWFMIDGVALTWGLGSWRSRVLAVQNSEYRRRGQSLGK